MALKPRSIVEDSFGTMGDESQSSPAGEGDASTAEQAAGPAVTLVAGTTPSEPPPQDAVDPHAGTPGKPTPATTDEKSKAARRSDAPKKSGRKPANLREADQQRRNDLRLRASVEESFRSAKRRSKEWGPAPIRISSVAKKRLAQRREQDEEILGVKFNETHYIDAALADVPQNPTVAMQWVEEYLDTLDLVAPDTTGTTSRLRKETKTSFDAVTRRMRTLHGYGYIGALQTAAVLRLLDSLDRADQWLASEVVDLDED
jgi:hypothetical protein